MGMAGAGGTVGGRTMLPVGSNTSMKSSSSRASWVSPTSVSASGKRIQREMSELKVDLPPYCSAGPKDDNLYKWVATVIGPPGYFQGMIIPLDILKESWSSALTIAKVLLAIRSIFTNPDPCTFPER